MNEIRLDFGKPNEFQKRGLDAFRAGKRFVQMVSGRQAGKSTLGARWLIGETANTEIKNKLGLIVAPTFRVARVAIRKMNEVLQTDLRLWKRIKYVSQPIPTFTFPNGWIIEVHSTDDPNALRGPTASRIWHDEPGDSNPEAFDILTPTLLAEEGKYLATGTPRGQHNWTYKKLYLPSCPPGHEDHDPDLYNPIYESIVGSTWDNVENLSEEAIISLEAQYGGKDSAFARQEIYGEFVSFDGLVYSWDERTNFIPRDQMPARNEFSFVVGGIDFGWVDPSCAVVAGYKGGTWYILDGIHESNLPIDELAAHVSYMQSVWQPQLWWADSARPDSIYDLQTRGLPVRPVVKPEIEERVREMALFADHNRLKVSYSVPFVRDELQMYQYPPEEKLMRDAKRRPIDRSNHAMDAIGYLIYMNRHLWRNDFRVRIRTEDGQEDDPDDIELIERPKVRRYIHHGPAGLVGR